MNGLRMDVVNSLVQSLNSLYAGFFSIKNQVGAFELAKTWNNYLIRYMSTCNTSWYAGLPSRAQALTANWGPRFKPLSVHNLWLVMKIFFTAVLMLLLIE